MGEESFDVVGIDADTDVDSYIRKFMVHKRNYLINKRSVLQFTDELIMRYFKCLCE
jgi:hypothetical protein